VRGLIAVVLWAAGAGAACSGSSETSRDGGSLDAPAGNDASAADVASDVYTCLPYPCYNVIVGGAPGSALPDPGVIFVETGGGHLVTHPTRNIIYASMWPGAIEGISTDTGERIWQATGPQGFPTERLAITDDGSKIYATGYHSDWVVRFDVASSVADLVIDLSPEPSPFEVTDIATIPGSPRSVLVAADRLVVFDDNVARPAQVPMPAGTFRLRTESATTAYLLDSGIAGSLTTLTLSGNGVQAGAPVPGLFTPGLFEFVLDGQWAFGDDGHVVDPRTGMLLGMYEAGALAVDRAGNRAYVSPPPVFNVWEMFVDEYDRTSFTRLRRLKLSLQASVIGGVVRTANGTLAVDSNASIHTGYGGIILIKPEAWSAATTP
jgi:hypothetical protein